MEFFERVDKTENAVVLNFQRFNLDGALLLQCTQIIPKEIEAILQERKNIVLDFSGVVKVENFFSGTLVTFAQELKKFSCRLVLCNVEQHFATYLKRCRLLDVGILSIFPTQEEALSFLQEKALPS